MKKYQLTAIAVISIAAIGYGFWTIYNQGTARAYTAGRLNGENAGFAAGRKEGIAKSDADKFFADQNYDSLKSEYNSLVDKYNALAQTANAPKFCTTHYYSLLDSSTTSCY